MKKKRISFLELRVQNILDHHKFPEPVKEFRFHPTRMWRFDFAWVNEKIAIEIDGGIWNKGGHVRGIHYTSDCDKFNQAIILGWKVLRYTDKNIFSIPDDLGKLIHPLLRKDDT